MTTVTHEHRGGSVGGEGQNDAECACGIGFRGFDTHTDAMAVLNEHIAEANATPDPWAVLAAELTGIATDLAALAGSGLPVPNYVELSLMPGEHGNDESVVTGIDTVARALLDKPGQVSKMSNGTYHYDAKGRRGPVSISLLNAISTEFAEPRQYLAEMHGLRAQLATAEADAAKLRAELAQRAGLTISDSTIEQAGRMGSWNEKAGTWDDPSSTEYEPEGRTTAVAEAKPDTLGVPLGHHGANGAQVDVQSERSKRDLDRYEVRLNLERPQREHWERVLAKTDASVTSPAGLHSKAAHAEAMPVLHDQALAEDQSRRTGFDRLLYMFHLLGPAEQHRMALSTVHGQALAEDEARPPTCRQPVGDGYQRCDVRIEPLGDGWTHIAQPGGYGHFAVRTIAPEASA